MKLDSSPAQALLAITLLTGVFLFRIYVTATVYAWLLEPITSVRIGYAGFAGLYIIKNLFEMSPPRRAKSVGEAVLIGLGQVGTCAFALALAYAVKLLMQ